MERILVVDDEVEILESLREFLTSIDYEVHTAANGSDAIRKVEDVKPDVVLLDIIMPGMGGFDVLKKIRDIDPDIGIIMATAVADEELARRTLNLGAYDYITKPFDLGRVEEVVMIKMAERRG